MNNDYNNNWQPNNFQPMPPQGPQPGQGAATGSLICGIISLVATVIFGWTTFLALAGMVVGIVGVVLAVNAKKQGYNGGMQTAGLVLSIIGAALSAVVFVACIACICIGSAALADGYANYSYDFDLDDFLNSI